MRLAFMGTPDFAVPTLRALAEAGHRIAAVYTQPARPAGRGKKPRPSPVQQAAEALGLPVRTPETLRDAGAQAAFAALALDAAVVVAYGLLLPEPVLAAPRLGCFNLHASLLPRWPGAAPNQRAVMAGDAETGVCAMRMEAGLDTGPTALCRAAPIGPRDTAGDLHDRLAALGAPLMVEALEGVAAGRLALTPQPAEGATYARKIDKAETRIDWTRPAAEVDATIRGLSPAPGAWTMIGEERVRLLLSAVGNGAGPPGTALDDRLLIACGAGAVRILRAQRPGRGPAEATAFLNGFAVAAGTRLGGGA